jgi:WD40 repeat protein
VAPSTTSATTSQRDEPVPGGLPRSFFAVTTTGHLVEISTETGETIKELAFIGDPTDVPDGAEIAPNFIYGVALPPAGELLYYEECCEPASGVVDRISYEGGAAEAVNEGSNPAVSPDGRYLATSDTAGTSIVATNGVTGQVPYPLVARFDSTVTGHQSRVAWSLDGRHLYVEVFSGDVTSSIAVLAFDGSSLLVERQLIPPEGEAWTSPAVRADGTLVVAASDVTSTGPSRGTVIDPASGAVLTTFDLGSRVRSMAYDPTGTWLIVVHEDGTLTWSGAGQSGVLAHESDVGFVAADW